jgi:hypothetical protein
MIYMIHEQIGNEGIEQYAIRLTPEMEEQYKQYPNMYKKYIVERIDDTDYWKFIYNRKRSPFKSHKLMGDKK